jgi:hypothetical protein
MLFTIYDVELCLHGNILFYFVNVLVMYDISNYNPFKIF